MFLDIRAMLITGAGMTIGFGCRVNTWMKVVSHGGLVTNTISGAGWTVDGYWLQEEVVVWGPLCVRV